MVSGRVTRAEVIELGTWQPGAGGPPLDTATIELTMAVDRWLVGGGDAPPAEITYVTTHVDGVMCDASLGVGLQRNLLLVRDDDGHLRLQWCGAALPYNEWGAMLPAAEIFGRAPPRDVSAEDPDPDHQGIYAHHVMEAHGISVSHAWTTATGGDTAQVYMDLITDERVLARLQGATADIADHVELVDFGVRNGQNLYLPRPRGVSVDWGQMQYLLPYGPSLQLSGLHDPLVEGDVLSMTLHFALRNSRPQAELVERIQASGGQADLSDFYDEVDIPITVDVLAPDAMDHPHAVRSPWGW